MACGSGVQITEESWGCADGKEVKRYSLKNSNELVVQVINYGASIQSILIPGKCGKTTDIVLGFDEAKGYAEDSHHFGATIGRTAGRTKPTKFKLGSTCVVLVANQPDDVHLHGGCKGFSKVIWDSKIEGEFVVMTYCSPAGEEGYPGSLTVTACFTLTEENELKINYKATTDALTIVSMTSHAYFNLAGHNAGGEKLLQHELQIEADEYLEMQCKIATGEKLPVKCTPYDFTKKKMICESIGETDGGYDNAYVLRGDGMKKAASLLFKPTCTTMEVCSSAPVMTFYDGSGLDGVCGKEGAQYNANGGLCLETEGYPNAPNIKCFPPIHLCPNDEYSQQIVYKFGFKKQ